MAIINLTLFDTPTGTVAISHNFTPAAGYSLTPAQAHALDVINRTHHLYGKSSGVDIDAVHSTLDDVLRFASEA